jgi:uncharacterized protein YdhG (YjbR/CyaY superfamily)
MKQSTAKNINEYLSALPADQRTALEKIRKAIKTAHPKAKEIISYQMPMFKYEDSPAFAAFAAFKSHCSYFTMSHAIMRDFKDELKPFNTSGVTIHFSSDNMLSAALVKKLAKAKIKENEIKKKKKLNKK